MALMYRVAKMFAHEGRLFTNTPKDLRAIKRLRRAVRDDHIAKGNLVEWKEQQSESSGGETTTNEED